MPPLTPPTRHWMTSKKPTETGRYWISRPDFVGPPQECSIQFREALVGPEDLILYVINDNNYGPLHHYHDNVLWLKIENSD